MRSRSRTRLHRKQDCAPCGIGVCGFVLLSLLLAGCAPGPADTERVSEVVSSTLSTTPPPAGSSTTPSLDESAPTESATTSQLLDSAREQLASMKQSDYQHQTDVDTTAGRYDYDCSGLLDYTIGVLAPDALAQIPTTPSAGRALAENFEGFFAGLTREGRYWAPVATVPDLVGGDVIAWLITPDTASRDTGHIMIVVAPPVADPHNADAYLVEVIDSTTMPHAEDSRSSGQQGLGTGTIGLQTDGAGAPTGFYWKGGVAPEMPTHVALARLVG